MISLWRICFSTVLITAGMAAATVSGMVELRDSRDKRVSAGNDYSGVVVWLSPSRPGPAPKPAILRSFPGA